MNFLPKMEKVKEIAESGRYDILPVSCEMMSDTEAGSGQNDYLSGPRKT